jgi:hypothetical protein
VKSYFSFKFYIKINKLVFIVSKSQFNANLIFKIGIITLIHTQVAIDIYTSIENIDEEFFAL